MTYLIKNGKIFIEKEDYIMKLELVKMPLDDETLLGESHILGCPDVPSVWNDDAIFFNDEVFVGQINLKDVNNPLLPNSGILYFFFASMSKPYRGIVRYTGDFTSLERIDFNEEAPLKFNYNQEYKISFIDEDGDVTLLGKMPKLQSYKPTSNEVCLLKLDFSNYPEIDLFKDITDPVCFLIKKEDLENKAFDKAYLANSLN